MPTKIRLQRKGKKGQPFYHIVIADGRAPRDGRLIEKIGTYNPLTKPANIDISFDRALYWLQTGAQPTDTVRAILSYKGLLYKYHLLKGVKKGALTQEQADVKFDVWLKEKEDKIAGKTKEVENAQIDEQKKRMAAEKKINEERAKELAEKRMAAINEEAAAEASEDAAQEVEPEAEVKEEAKEEPKAEAKEEPKAEVKEEPKAEEKEEPKAEVKEEPKAEVKEEPKAEVKEEPKAEVKEEAKEEKKEEPKAEKKEAKEEPKAE